MKSDYQFWVEQAFALASTGQWTLCLKACQKAIICEPSGPDFLRIIGLRSRAYSALGRVEEASHDERMAESFTVLYPDKGAS